VFNGLLTILAGVKVTTFQFSTIFDFKV